MIDLSPFISFYPAFLNTVDADSLFNDLKANTDWQQTYYNFNGRSVPAPRLVALIGSSSYTYTGLTLKPSPIPDSLLNHISKIADATSVTYTGALLNYYRNGKDSVGFHSDNEPELGINPTIASLSLGASRKFVLLDNLTGNKYQVILQHGDLLVMHGECQQRFKHSIPKTQLPSDERINITLRNFK